TLSNSGSLARTSAFVAWSMASTAAPSHQKKWRPRAGAGAGAACSAGRPGSADAAPISGGAGGPGGVSAGNPRAPERFVAAQTERGVLARRHDLGHDAPAPRALVARRRLDVDDGALRFGRQAHDRHGGRVEEHRQVERDGLERRVRLEALADRLLLARDLELRVHGLAQLEREAPAPSQRAGPQLVAPAGE